MPFDKELWKHSTPSAFEKQAHDTQPIPPLDQQQVLKVSVSAAFKASARQPKKTPPKTKRKG